MRPMPMPWNTARPGAALLPDTWDDIRRPPRHADEALTGTARVWLRKLPPGRRPDRLCEQFPRLVNQIAWHWRDPAEAREVLEGLLVDRRGGRQGFPRPIVLELRRLRDYLDRAADVHPDGGRWQVLRQLWSWH